MASKKRKSHPGLPHGMSYADVLSLKKEAVEQVIESSKDECHRILSDRQAQRMAWLYMVALHNRFGFGEERQRELEKAVMEELQWYKENREKADQDFADEKLRRQASAACNRALEYAHGDLPVNMELDEDALAILREAEGRVY